MILDKFKLDGKVAIVTGASRGIGQAIAMGLAEAGAEIVGVARGDMEKTERAVTALGRKFLPMNADLSSIEPIDRIFDETLSAFGKVDILVNGAGLIKRRPAIEFTEKDWDVVLDTNLKTVFFMCQRAAKEFVKQRKGKVINIASMLSFQGGILVSSYTASKSGIMGITRLMANEWGKFGINVNAIAPGYIATEMTSQIRENNERNKSILERIPAGRWGAPEDIKGAAVFLASEASDYVNGFTIAVDGGWLAS
jgi:2-deoxy-D-gluconate 3-dehydrogenase